MTINDIIKYFPGLKNTKQIHLPIHSISRSSHDFQPGDVFVAIRGNTWDGHSFVAEAAKSASLLVVEDEASIPKDCPCAYLLAKDSREVLAKLASLYFERPSEKLFSIGITGTNGKTTSSYLVEQIFQHAQVPIGVMGTINHHLGKRIWDTKLTSPGPIELQGRLKEYLDLGAKANVIEISSHALDQKRVFDLQLDVAVFTNFSQDHLDYHKTMQNYLAAKAKLFTEILSGSEKQRRFAILNADEPACYKIEIPEEIQIYRYGELSEDFRFSHIRQDYSGSVFDLHSPIGHHQVKLKMPGRHNIYNSLAAIATAYCYGISIDQSIEALKDFNGVPGRLETVDNPKSLHVFVDYAHTEEALENVLRFLNRIRQEENLKSKIITVFGAGGDRDKGKRPRMGRIASLNSDQLVITSDNPRNEDPQQIIDEILEGVVHKERAMSDVDRREAIHLALQSAAPGDVVLIAGKGHEKTQLIGSNVEHFSDREVVVEYFQ